MKKQENKITKTDQKRLSQDIQDLKIVMAGTLQDVKNRYGWNY